MIEFQAVSKTFRGGKSAVADLSLTAPTDKITVLVGPPGSGKSTALRLINRMIEPTSGKIRWDGSPVRSRRKTALRREMGYVSQEAGLFPHRTVVENIGTVPDLLRWSKDKTRKRSEALLDRVGLDRKLAHRYPAELSTVQQQRVAIARALAAEPKVLLLDEPFAAVDPGVRSELEEFILGLQRETSKTVVLGTADIDEALRLGDQVAILRAGGRLAQVGSPAELLDEPADAFVDGFIGRDRGYRSLSYRPASALTLARVKVVRDAEAATGSEPTLVVDGEARPLGWADRNNPGRVFPLGSTFHHESDTLRHALDSALTSPYSLAVAVVRDTGRFAGVVAAASILSRVKDVRVAVAESISVTQAAAQRPELPVPAVTAAPGTKVEAEASPAEEAESTDTTESAKGAESTATAATGSSPEDQTTSEHQVPSKDQAPPDEKASPVDQTPEAKAPPEEHPPLVDNPDDTVVRAAVPPAPIPESTAPATEEPDDATVVAGKPVDLTQPDVPDLYPFDESEYPTEGGHSDSADDAANSDDPDDDVEIDLDELDLDLVAEREPVR